MTQFSLIFKKKETILTPFYPKRGNETFPDKSGFVTPEHLWSPDFMQKTEKKTINQPIPRKGHHWCTNACTNGQAWIYRTLLLGQGTKTSKKVRKQQLKRTMALSLWGLLDNFFPVDPVWCSLANFGFSWWMIEVDCAGNHLLVGSLLSTWSSCSMCRYIQCIGIG